MDIQKQIEYMIQVPDEWDNVASWDEYFTKRIKSESCPHDGLDIFAHNNLEDIAKNIRDNGVSTIWIPGCGLSQLPTVLAALGFRVFATDFSSVVVDYQLSGEIDISHIPIKLDKKNFVCELHDHRKAYRENEIDLILNIKAFQGFNQNDLKLVAQSHFKTLRGREAIFSTLNCQGEIRDQIEEALVNAGFFIPFYELEKEYRKSLNATGIPYAFVLGRPVIPQVDIHGNPVERWYDEDWRSSSKALLREITVQFEQHKTEVLDEENRKFESDNTKYANIIYNTG